MAATAHPSTSTLQNIDVIFISINQRACSVPAVYIGPLKALDTVGNYSK